MPTYLFYHSAARLVKNKLFSIQCLSVQYQIKTCYCWARSFIVSWKILSISELKLEYGCSTLIIICLSSCIKEYNNPLEFPTTCSLERLCLAILYCQVICLFFPLNNSSGNRFVINFDSSHLFINKGNTTGEFGISSYCAPSLLCTLQHQIYQPIINVHKSQYI